jgi:chromosome segregation ATPase
VVVHDDPRVGLTDGQRKEIFDAQQKAGELQKQLNTSRTDLDEYRRQVTGAVLKAEGPAKEALDALSKQISALSARIQAPAAGLGGGGFGGGRGPGGGAGAAGTPAPGTAAPGAAAGAAGTRPAPVMNEIEREQMMLQMQRAISSTISGQLSSVVSSLEGFTLPVTAETKADIKELSSKLKSLAADVKNIGVGVRKIVPAPVKKD